MGHQRHLDRVRGLVSGHTGVPEAEITLETRLVEDLGMDGDDGQDFLDCFADEFGVDMRAMAPANYFADEGACLPVPSLVGLAALCLPRFRARVRHAARGRRSLSLRDLVATAQMRRWRSPGQPRSEFAQAWPGALSLMVCAGLAVWGLGDGEPLAVLAAAALLGLLGLRFLRDLAWLRRLEAAAGFEERALSEGC